MRGRSKTFKYKNYQYSDEVKQLLDIPLSDYDKNYINDDLYDNIFDVLKTI